MDIALFCSHISLWLTFSVLLASVCCPLRPQIARFEKPETYFVWQKHVAMRFWALQTRKSLKKTVQNCKRPWVMNIVEHVSRARNALNSWILDMPVDNFGDAAVWNAHWSRDELDLHAGAIAVDDQTTSFQVKGLTGHKCTTTFVRQHSWNSH